jgi:hypothetical protein
LEYGIFVNHLGRARTVIVCKTDVRLPSDLLGINVQPDADDSSITELVVKHFDAQFGDIHLSPLQEINLVADPETIDEQLHSPPSAASWHIRDLYFGLEGAKAWLAVVNDPSYSPHDQERKLRQAIM